VKLDFEHKTIRRRLAILFAVIFCLIVLLVASLISNTFVLKADFFAIERFYNFFNNVLELRRYEKNLLFKGESENYQQVIAYLNRLEQDSNNLEKDIRKVAETDAVDKFRLDLSHYRRFLEDGHARGQYNVASIRHIGKKLVDFSQHLMFVKRNQIHRAIKWTTIIFVAVTSIAFILVVLVFYSQTRSILKRLSLVQHAAMEVAHGHFVSIPEAVKTKDEISGLIHAFNQMVEELDLRQEQLLKARKLAAIGTFSSGIAHELNNPLNNISLTVDTLLEEFKTISREEAREFLDDIARQTERASTVVKNLLDFSRETLPTESRMQVVDVIRLTGKLVENQLRLSSIKLEDHLPSDLPPIRGNFQKLQQVFLNLYLNAIHAMPKGGLIQITGVRDPEGYIRIDFSDTGSGIPPAKLDRIFDPFFTTKPVGKGTGLGLSIVYGIVQKHGGYIEVKSEINKGTIFSIYLPAPEEEQLNDSH